MKIRISAILLLLFLSSSGAAGYTFYVAPHSHIDLEWFWRYEHGRVFSIRILRQAMTMLKADPRFTFTQDQALALRPFWDSLNAGEREFMRRMAGEGRFEVATGMCVQPDVNMSDFESLTRQFLEGKQWMEQTFGAKVRTAWNLDTFGQTSQMPQLFHRAGIPYFVFMRDAAPEWEQSVKSPFYWKSPDGSTVLAHWLSGSYGVHDGPLLVASLKRYVEHNAEGNDKIFIPWGDDVTMPDQTTAVIEQHLRKAAAEAKIPVREVVFSTPSRYFEVLRSSGVRLPTYTHDFNPPLLTADLRGLPAERPASKLANRKAESALESGEKFAALAYALGATYPEAELRGGWAKLLMNQSHDTVAGSHTDDVYEIALSRFAGAIEAGRSVTGEALYRISRQIDTSSGGRFPFVVFNSTSTVRDELVEYVPLFKSQLSNFRIVDPAGKPVPFRTRAAYRRGQRGMLAMAVIEFVAHAMPPLGYRLYRVEPLEGVLPPLEWKPAPEQVASGHFELRLDRRKGTLAGIVDRHSGQELLDTSRYGGNELVLQDEKSPDVEGTLSLTGREVREEAPATVAVAEDALGTLVRIEGPFLGGRKIQEISLYRTPRRIDFTTRMVGFPGRNGMLAAVFPLRNGRNLYEVHNAVIERPAGIFAAQRWAGVEHAEGGVAILNQGTGGYAIDAGTLRLYLLRSILDYKQYHAPAASEAGDHRFRYSLYSYPGAWPAGDVIAQAQSFNQEPAPVPVDAHPGPLPAEHSFVQVAGGGFEITALKRAAGGPDLILRGHETNGRAGRIRLKLSLPAASVRKADLLEQPRAALPVGAGGIVEFDCAPFEFVTLRIRLAATSRVGRARP
ncbi:MAG: glycosyl hydrolase-related protein [Acidobacteria bacterium]|nr:glycosyl hydrolase-related protein [Acidobacteriota bacterium]